MSHQFGIGDTFGDNPFIFDFDLVPGTVSAGGSPGDVTRVEGLPFRLDIPPFLEFAGERNIRALAQAFLGVDIPGITSATRPDLPGFTGPIGNLLNLPNFTPLVQGEFDPFKGPAGQVGKQSAGVFGKILRQKAASILVKSALRTIPGVGLVLLGTDLLGILRQLEVFEDLPEPVQDIVERIADFGFTVDVQNIFSGQPEIAPEPLPEPIPDIPPAPEPDIFPDMPDPINDPDFDPDAPDRPAPIVPLPPMPAPEIPGVPDPGISEPSPTVPQPAPGEPVPQPEPGPAPREPLPEPGGEPEIIDEPGPIVIDVPFPFPLPGSPNPPAPAPEPEPIPFIPFPPFPSPDAPPVADDPDLADDPFEDPDFEPDPLEDLDPDELADPDLDLDPDLEEDPDFDPDIDLDPDPEPDLDFDPDVEFEPDPVDDLEPRPDLNLNPDAQQQQCQIVQSRTRRRGLCQQGYFEDTLRGTKFIAWREVSCVTGRQRKSRSASTVSEVLRLIETLE